MKAYQIGQGYGIDSLMEHEVDISPILPSQMLVKIKSVSLNYRDRLVIDGIDKWKPPVGRVPTSDGMGVVVSVGQDTRNIRIGDRVAIMFFPYWSDGKLSKDKMRNSLGGSARDGTLQQYIVVGENEVVKIPDDLTDEEASTLPCAALTAWNSLFENGNLQRGNSILIQGTGGVSLFSLQFAQMVGAIPIVITSTEEKEERLKNLGVEHIINYSEHPNWESEVLEITNGEGVDYVVEVVGGSNINRSLTVAGMESTISVIGLINGMSGNVDFTTLMGKQVKLQGIEVGSKEMFVNMLTAIEKNKLHPIVDRIFKFEDTKQAFNYLVAGKHFGKICISV